MTKKKKTPIRHKVKQHTRKKPTGGTTTVHRYWRGRGVRITPGLVEEIHPGLRKRKIQRRAQKIQWFDAPTSFRKWKSERTPEEVDITVFSKKKKIIAGGIDYRPWTRHYTYGELEKKLQELWEFKPDGAETITATSRYDGHLIARVGK